MELKKVKILLIVFLFLIIFIILPTKTQAANIQNAIWFMDNMYIMQVPNGDFSHRGTQNFDVVGYNGNNNIFAPFDCKVVAMYTEWRSGNTVVIESLNEVQYADGTRGYMSMAFAHDNDVSNLYVGKVIRQGEVFYQTGDYGNVTGVHSHVTCIRGKYQWDMWTVNSYGQSCSPNAIPPTSALFITRNTNVIQTLGLNFKLVSVFNDMNINNLGNDFYSAITENKNSLNVTDNTGGYLELKENEKDAKQMWHFMRQDDGSYIIQNSGTQKFLDVYGFNDYDGGRVWTYPYNGSTAQKWYIYGNRSGEYILKPQCSDRVLDINGGVNKVGDRLNLWSFNNGVAQQFALNPIEGVGATTLNFEVTESETKFSWLSVKNATSYTVKIQKGTPGNVTQYKAAWELKTLSYSVKLPVGYYEAYIDSANYYSFLMSNVVKFYVNSDQTITVIKGDINGDKIVNINDVNYGMRGIVNKVTLTEDEKKVGDVNNDGKFNINDINTIMRLIVGKIDEF